MRSREREKFVSLALCYVHNFLCVRHSGKKKKYVHSWLFFFLETLCWALKCMSKAACDCLVSPHFGLGHLKTLWCSFKWFETSAWPLKSLPHSSHSCLGTPACIYPTWLANSWIVPNLPPQSLHWNGLFWSGTDEMWTFKLFFSNPSIDLTLTICC